MLILNIFEVEQWTCQCEKHTLFRLENLTIYFSLKLPGIILPITCAFVAALVWLPQPWLQQSFAQIEWQPRWCTSGELRAMDFSDRAPCLSFKENLILSNNKNI